MKTLESSRLRSALTYCGCAAVAIALVASEPINCAQAATLRPGDLVVAVQRKDYGSDFWRIDPVTRERTIISDSTHGAGPMVHGAASFVIAPDGQLLVADQGSPLGVLHSGAGGATGLFPPQMLTIDPTTGDRTPLPVPSEALADRHTVIAGQIGNQIIASSTSQNDLTTGIISVDRLTGAATTIMPSGPGSGSSFYAAFYMAIRGDQAFVAAPYAGSIVQVDLNTLVKTPITSSPVQNQAPLNLAFDSQGDLIVLTYQAGILRVDPTTGNQSPISNDTFGTGPAFAGTYGPGMAVSANNPIYLLRKTGSELNGTRTILRVDPATGDRHTVADLTDLGRAITAIAVVPKVPEPSTIALAAVGGVLLLLRWQRFARVTRRQTLLSVVVLCFTVGNPNAASAVTLHPGDIIVTGSYGKFDGAIYRVDPVTGEPTLIADNSHGAGPVMRNIVGISIASDGQLWVADRGTRGSINDVPNYAAQILKVDPATGNRVAVPGQTPNLSSLARERDDRLIVSAHQALYSIDPVSGAKTLISGLGVGSGPSLIPGQFDLSGNYAFTISFPNITKVDLTTGARTNIPGPNVGPVAFFMANDIAIDSAGFLIQTAVWVTGSTAQTAVFRTDPSTGDIVTITSPSVGGGDPLPGGLDEEHLQILGGLGGVAVGDDGSIFASAIGVGLSGVFKIDPVTGDRQLLSNFYDVMPLVYGVAIVPNVPEPSTMLLSVLGGLLVLFYRRRHARPACKNHLK